MTAVADNAPDRQPARAAGRLAPLALPATALVLLAALAWALWSARGWPLIHDASIMHYIVFLSEHGLAPYRDVPDINMPGAHLSEALVMHTFGGDAAAWRMWDLTLGLLGIGACVWIAGPGLRWAGVAAGALGYLAHLSDGPMDLGQRDWLVAILLLGALGCLMSALRRGAPAWMAGASMLCGFAASIKPHVVLVGLAFFAAACWLARPGPADRRAPMRGGLGAMALYAALGMVPPALMTAAYLTWWNAWAAFFAIVRGVTTSYAGLNRAPAGDILGESMWPVVVLVGVITALWPGRRERRWDLELAALGVAGGALLFIIQGKGWAYHRYPEMAFFFLWAALASARSLARGAAGRAAALAGMGLCALFGLAFAWAASGATYPDRNLPALEADLRRLGGPSLSGQVQCMDMVMGSCITALYDLKLVNATGLIGDIGFFPGAPSPTPNADQLQFTRLMATRPPKVIVVTAFSWLGGGYTYDKLKSWPAFTDMLARRYRLDHEAPSSRLGVGYRLYVLNDQRPQAGRR